MCVLETHLHNVIIQARGFTDWCSFKFVILKWGASITVKDKAFKFYLAPFLFLYHFPKFLILEILLNPNYGDT